MRTLTTGFGERKTRHFICNRHLPLEQWQLQLAVGSLIRNWRRNFMQRRYQQKFHRNGLTPGGNRLGPSLREYINRKHRKTKP
jgi:hypothetical protein